MKTALLILAFNEEKFIENVIKKYIDIFNEVIVIDDCSIDNTKLIVEGLKESNKNLTLISNEKNMGAGKSLEIGINYFLKSNNEYLIKIDGDDQFSKKDVLFLYKLLEKEHYDFIKCDRFWHDGIVGKIPTIRYKWHQRVLKMPVFGDMILKSLIARISLIMGNLSSAGVNLLESIEIAKQVSNNDVVTQALENVKKGVFSGDTLTKLFLKEPVFPPTFSQLISVGEQTGNLDEMFTSVSSYYEEEFDTAVDNMSSLIEPIMIVFMGLMIGGLMIAMYSPIFNVGAIIGG